jgi:hypothetical protein
VGPSLRDSEGVFLTERHVGSLLMETTLRSCLCGTTVASKPTVSTRKIPFTSRTSDRPPVCLVRLKRRFTGSPFRRGPGSSVLNFGSPFTSDNLTILNIVKKVLACRLGSVVQHRAPMIQSQRGQQHIEPMCTLVKRFSSFSFGRKKPSDRVLTGFSSKEVRKWELGYKPTSRSSKLKNGRELPLVQRKEVMILAKATKEDSSREVSSSFVQSLLGKEISLSKRIPSFGSLILNPPRNLKDSIPNSQYDINPYKHSIFSNNSIESSL